MHIRAKDNQKRAYKMWIDLEQARVDRELARVEKELEDEAPTRLAQFRKRELEQLEARLFSGELGSKEELVKIRNEIDACWVAYHQRTSQEARARLGQVKPRWRDLRATRMITMNDAFI